MVVITGCTREMRPTTGQEGSSRSKNERRISGADHAGSMTANLSKFLGATRDGGLVEAAFGRQPSLQPRKTLSSVFRAITHTTDFTAEKAAQQKQQ